MVLSPSIKTLLNSVGAGESYMGRTRSGLAPKPWQTPALRGSILLRTD